MTKAEQYIQDVVSGSIITGKAIRQAVYRHLSDMEKQDDPDFLYEFIEEDAARALRLFHLFRHGKGKWRGQKFNLMPWQAFAVWCAYGWKRKTDGKRRFNKVYIKVARKNAKTEFLACVGMIGFLFDAEQDPEVYWFATKKDQAKIGWDRQKQILLQARKDSRAIAQKCDTSTYRMFTTSGSGFVSYLGQDSDTEDGLSPYYGLCDEYHAHKTDDMMNVIESGMGARDNPMTWIITTAGFNSQGPCAQFEKVCKQILDGSLDNERIFALIYDLDEGDDWNDPAVWVKANPALPHIDTLNDFLRSEYDKAKTQGKTKEINFKTKNLNVWTSTHSTWIPDDKWQEAGADFDLSELAGRECYAGLDLASTRDLCSLCLIFPPETKEGAFLAVWYHWLPQEEAEEREKNAGIPYTQWAADGWITLTDGNVRHDDLIIDQIVTLLEKYDIRVIAYDRWGAANIVSKLTEHGLDVQPFGQGYASMSAPTKEVERLVFEKRLNHGNNPVMRWQASNVAVQMDPAENIKVAKNKSTEKVDGMVALVMALGIYMDASMRNETNNVQIYFLNG